MSEHNGTLTTVQASAKRTAAVMGLYLLAMVAGMLLLLWGAPMWLRALSVGMVGWLWLVGVRRYMKAALRLSIGADGLRIDSAFRRRFHPYRNVIAASVLAVGRDERPLTPARRDRPRFLAISLRDTNKIQLFPFGSTVELHAKPVRLKNRSTMNRIAASINDQIIHIGIVPQLPQAKILAQQAQRRGDARGPYRATRDVNMLWDVIESPAASPATRIAATLLLGDQVVAPRLKAVADRLAYRPVAQALHDHAERSDAAALKKLLDRFIEDELA